MPIIDVVVNGTLRRLDADPQRSLLTVLREDLELTGSKYGCGEGQCGACTVLIERTAHALVPDQGRRPSPARSVVTIEGLETGGQPIHSQEAFLEAGAMQCGFCTAGMIVAGAGLLRRNPDPEAGDPEGPGGQRVPLRDLPAHRGRRAGGGAPMRTRTTRG